MKRAWASNHVEAWEGDDDAAQAATALAQIADAEFIRSVVAAKGALDHFGGQFLIVAKRVPVNAKGEQDPDGKERRTVAYVHCYEHVATALREGGNEPNRTASQVYEQLDRPVANGDGPPEEETVLGDDSELDPAVEMDAAKT